MRVAFVLVLLLVVHLFASNCNIAESRALCRMEEKNALLDFKLSFTSDPDHALSTWSVNNPECCEWSGVECDNRTRHVVSLVVGEDLESHELRPSLLVLQHLRFLSFNSNRFTMRIPEFIGSLTKLTMLDLSGVGFFGKIPPHLGNLTKLQYLMIGKNPLYIDSLQWLSHLPSLQVVDLTDINLSNATDWFSTLKMLPSLSMFYCSSCSLPPIPPLAPSMCRVNHSTSLQDLDISFSSISSANLSCLINNTHNLQSLTLIHTNLNQLLPEFLPDLIHNARHSLEELYISDNNIEGNLDAILQHLPPNLTHLDLSANSLNGVISDTHFSKFSRLISLDLSGNYLLEFNFSESRVPPLQLVELRLSSCNLGPAFPNWVLTRIYLTDLDISNSSISGAIPSAFWNLASRFVYLNMSHNKVHSTVPNLMNNYPVRDATFDLSFNDFYGHIPLFMLSVEFLDVSNNKFSSFSTFHHEAVSNHYPKIINLSNNLLSGSIPNQIFQFNNLQILNLENNMLSGTIPTDIGNLQKLNAFHLNRNRFSGELPSSMRNCTQLTILDMGNNNFTGSVPFWLGDSLKGLIVLILRSNNFSEGMPSNLCHLQKLQVLDLSGNKISGSVPSCVHNFTSMTTNEGFKVKGNVHFSYIGTSDPINPITSPLLDYATIMWKGILANESSKNLPQWNVINLSNNRLTGEVPSEVISLKYLRSLDISQNNLSGRIPEKIGQLKFLEVLKLSSNRLCGALPQSLADMNFLDALNLSSNNLSGRIPKSTQLQSLDPSSFAGNPALCGEPLSTKCPGDGEPPPPLPLDRDHTREEANATKFDLEAFIAALGTGFACGLFGILGILNFHARSRHAFFHMASEVGDCLFVKVALCQSRFKRSLGL